MKSYFGSFKTLTKSCTRFIQVLYDLFIKNKPENFHITYKYNTRNKRKIILDQHILEPFKNKHSYIGNKFLEKLPITVEEGTNFKVGCFLTKNC